MQPCDANAISYVKPVGPRPDSFDRPDNLMTWNNWCFLSGDITFDYV